MFGVIAPLYRIFPAPDAASPMEKCVQVQPVPVVVVVGNVIAVDGDTDDPVTVQYVPLRVTALRAYAPYCVVVTSFDVCVPESVGSAVCRATYKVVSDPALLASVALVVDLNSSDSSSDSRYADFPAMT